MRLKRSFLTGVVAMGLAALGSVYVSGQDQKPKVTIPNAGVPQIMTMEGKFVRAAYNNEGYVILGYQLANSLVGEEWMLLEFGITVLDGVPNYTLTRNALSLETPDGKTLPLPTIMDAVFVFIGTKPRSEWLLPDVLRDAKGFVITGRELMAAEAYPRVWKETREPLPLETSVPGVFAAGDVRAGAMNRVASAVGEGSMVVRLAHDYLALT